MTWLYIHRSGQSIPCKVTGIEKFRKISAKAQAGENVGLLLSGIDRNMVTRGDIISKT